MRQVGRWPTLLRSSGSPQIGHYLQVRAQPSALAAAGRPRPPPNWAGTRRLGLGPGGIPSGHRPPGDRAGPEEDEELRCSLPAPPTRSRSPRRGTCPRPAPAGPGRFGAVVGCRRTGARPTARPARSAATILVAGPDGGPSAGRAIAAAAGRGLRVLISSGLDDFLRYSLIKAAILPVCVDRETAAALQVAVESDPGILLTVDFGRHEVRARGFVARFEIGGGTENMAERLRIAQRLLGSAALPGDVRVRLQRRLAAICDALKVPGADAARGARRLDLLLADLARSSSAGRPGGGAAGGGAAGGDAAVGAREAGAAAGSRAAAPGSRSAGSRSAGSRSSSRSSRGGSSRRGRRPSSAVLAVCAVLVLAVAAVVFLLVTARHQGSGTVAEPPPSSAPPSVTPSASPTPASVPSAISPAARPTRCR